MASMLMAVVLPAKCAPHAGFLDVWTRGPARRMLGKQYHVYSVQTGWKLEID